MRIAIGSAQVAVEKFGNLKYPETIDLELVFLSDISEFERGAQNLNVEAKYSTASLFTSTPKTILCKCRHLSVEAKGYLGRSVGRSISASLTI